MKLATPNRFLGCLLALLLSAGAAGAQTPEPGTCDYGTATGILNANDVRATLFNDGALFNDETFNGGGGQYYVPKDSVVCGGFLGCRPPSPIFTASLWVGGQVDGGLRVAGNEFGNFQFWPGPLGDDARPVDPADCSAFDRIFVVSRADIARYLRTGEATDDLRDWPAALGAPVLDGDGVEGNYDLAAGDQPAISGDETAWWVMNDVGNEHTAPDSPPLGIEARVSAFAKALPNPSTGLRAVDQATFYRYRLTNRNAVAIDSAYVSVFVNPSLGGYRNYIGSDTTRSLGYVYNARNADETYGSPPPAIGVAVLQGPIALPDGRNNDGDGEIDESGERAGMNSFYSVFDGPGFSEPQAPQDYFNVMRGLWVDGTPITEGLIGYGTDGDTLTFHFPGDAATEQFWSMVNADGRGSDLFAGERRFVVTTGPFRLEPGETEEVVFALVFARGGSNLGSVTLLRAATDEVRFQFEQGAFAPRPVTADEGADDPVDPVPPALPEDYRFAAYPNPVADDLTVRYALPAAQHVRLVLYDVLGREVACLVDGAVEPGEYTVAWSASDLPSGLYLLRAEFGSDFLAVTRRLVVIR